MHRKLYVHPFLWVADLKRDYLPLPFVAYRVFAKSVKLCTAI